jgi:hypothetical protein
MGWLEDWEQFIAAKEAELADLEIWIAAKMPHKISGRKTYEVISSDPLLICLLEQRLSLSREIAQAKKYITRKEAA